MKALIIGATGFVGGALTTRLAEMGWDAHGLFRTQPTPDAAGPGITAHVGTLADPNSIAKAAEGCDVVFHCAGENAEHAPGDALSWINVAGTENVVTAAKHAGVKRLVLLSCADVTLLNEDRLNWKEDQFLGGLPLGRLARSRLLAEELAHNASSARTSVIAVRPGLIWGPGDRGTLAQLCAEGAAGGIRLFGNGDNLLSTVFIDNLVDALLCAAQSSQTGAFHVSDSEFLSAMEFFGKLSSSLGLPPPRRGIYAVSYAAATLREYRQADGPWRAEVARRGRGSLLDCAKAHQQLDYRPATTFEEGMEKLTTWVQSKGGPEAICKTARTPASQKDIEHHKQVAGED